MVSQIIQRLARGIKWLIYRMCLGSTIRDVFSPGAGPTGYLGLFTWSFHRGIQVIDSCNIQIPALMNQSWCTQSLWKEDQLGRTPGLPMQALVCAPVIGPLPIDPWTGFHWQWVAKPRTTCNGSRLQEASSIIGPVMSCKGTQLAVL